MIGLYYGSPKVYRRELSPIKFPVLLDLLMICVWQSEILGGGPGKKEASKNRSPPGGFGWSDRFGKVETVDLVRLI